MTTSPPYGDHAALNRALIPTMMVGPNRDETPRGFKDLRIGHLSLQVFDTDRQAEQDLEQTLDFRFHLLGGTESGDRARKEVIHEVLEEEYHVFTPFGSDSWGAVRRSLVDSPKITNTYQMVLASGREAGDPHRYSSKGVLSLSWENDRLGPMGFVPGVHFLTQGRFPGQAQQDKPGDPVNHVAANRELGAAMADETLRLAKGEGIAWATADTNLVLRTQADKAVAGRPLTVCWEEVGHWPGTGHGNIDGVFSADSDGRVRCIRAVVHDDKDLFLHGDHFLVDTTYRVRLLR